MSKQRTETQQDLEFKEAPKKESSGIGWIGWFLIILILGLLFILISSVIDAFFTPAATQITLPSGLTIVVKDTRAPWAHDETKEFRVTSLTKGMDQNATQTVQIVGFAQSQPQPLPDTSILPLPQVSGTDNVTSQYAVEVTSQEQELSGQIAPTQATTYDTRCLTNQGVQINPDGRTFSFPGGVGVMTLLHPSDFGLPKFATMWAAPGRAPGELGGIGGCIPPGYQFQPKGMLNSTTGDFIPYPKVS